MAEGRFRLAMLLQSSDQPTPPIPASVRLWATATPVAAIAGLLAGAYRGAALGNARALAAIQVRGIVPHHRAAMIRAYTSRDMVRVALGNGGRMALFVGLLLGVDVLAIDYPQLAGPHAPALGGAVAGLLYAVRSGATAAVAATALGATMGLAFGVARGAVDLDRVMGEQRNTSD